MKSTASQKWGWGDSFATQKPNWHILRLTLILLVGYFVLGELFFRLDFVQTMLTMVLSGFWHGPNWQMLFWGALHGSYLVVERLLTLRQPPRLDDQKAHWYAWVSDPVTFLLVAVAWVPFMMRLPSALKFGQHFLIGRMWGTENEWLIYSLAVLIPAIWLDWAQYNKAEEMFFLQHKPVLQGAMLATMIVLILVVTSSGEGQPFVYQGF